VCLAQSDSPTAKGIYSPVPDPIISAHHLVKVFRTPARYPGRFAALRTLFTRTYTVKRAVEDVSFSVERGELIGYIGPNGAGKSTTIKMLTGILEPTSGNIDVAGVVPWRRREANALNIGVVFGQRSQLWWDLPLVESFDLVAQMYRVEAARYRANLGRFRELLALDAFIDTPVRQLSLGQRMRGELTAALLHDPAVVYLDEPTIGLDVVAKERIREFIAEINRDQGATVILTTHDLADVERLCRRIILIDLGRLLFDGSVERLKATYAPYRELLVRLAPDDSDAEHGNSSLEMPGVEVVRREPGQLRLRFDPSVVRVHELIGEVARRHRVTDLSITEPELEAVVRELYERPSEVDR
jgi:ABC-2 type transport system ATP-binding protein